MTQVATATAGGVGTLYTDKEIEEMYNKLKSSSDQAVRKPDPASELANKWTAPEFQIVSGYAVKVAKSSTLPEFNSFMRTGVLAHPVKMTAAEMELLQGGGTYEKVCLGIITVATCVAAGAGFCCA